MYRYLVPHRTAAKLLQHMHTHTKKQQTQSRIRTNASRWYIAVVIFDPNPTYTDDDENESVWTMERERRVLGCSTYRRNQRITRSAALGSAIECARTKHHYSVHEFVRVLWHTCIPRHHPDDQVCWDRTQSRQSKDHIISKKCHSTFLVYLM